MDKEFFNKYYYTEKLSFRSISQKTDISVGKVYRSFKKLGLNPIKHKVWNSGKTCFNDNRILSGVNHPRWKNKSKYYIDFKLKRKEIINGITKCDNCNKIATILHHKDKNTDNNEYNNLIPLCLSCHTTLHNKERGTTVYKHSCNFCGKEFIVLHNKNCKQQFCSLSCASKYDYIHNNNLYKHNIRDKTIYNKMCKYCKKEFTTNRQKQVFCSYSCAGHLKKH